MRKELQAYLTRMEETIGAGLDREQVVTLREDLFVHIQFFQHERLVHLIVTALVAILAMIALLCGLLQSGVWVWTLFLVLMVLLGFYIQHYYYLENGVQKMYQLYDRLGG